MTIGTLSRWPLFTGIMVALVVTFARANENVSPPDAPQANAPPTRTSPTRGALWAAVGDAEHARAGYPQSVRPHAGRAIGPGRVGYYVGGGAAVRGEGRDANTDGTWGLDYRPLVLPRRVALGWHHGSKSQGGTGAYATDGPKLRHE